MPRTLVEIEREIELLTAPERAQLLRMPIAKLDPPAEVQTDVEQAWIEEAKRRMAEIEAGTAKTVPWSEVMEEARARFK